MACTFHSAITLHIALFYDAFNAYAFVMAKATTKPAEFAYELHTFFLRENGWHVGGKAGKFIFLKVQATEGQIVTWEPIEKRFLRNWKFYERQMRLKSISFVFTHFHLNGRFFNCIFAFFHIWDGED